MRSNVSVEKILVSPEVAIQVFPELLGYAVLKNLLLERDCTKIVKAINRGEIPLQTYVSKPSYIFKPGYFAAYTQLLEFGETQLGGHEYRGEKNGILLNTSSSCWNMGFDKNLGFEFVVFKDHSCAVRSVVSVVNQALREYL